MLYYAIHYVSTLSFHYLNFIALVAGEKYKLKNFKMRAHFSSTYAKIGTIQRRSAWPLHNDDRQIREAFHIFKSYKGYDCSYV